MKTKLLLYCTKGKPNLWKRHLGFCAEEIPYDIDDIYCNGKIVAECECEVEKNANDDVDNVPRKPFLEETCLTFEQLDKYVWLCGGEPFYALHLTNIKTFEKPVELSECYGFNKRYCVFPDLLIPVKLTKAPQNMMQVWYNGEIYTLISIRPEWLCKILNGEKTIEVRRKILKVLEELMR